MDASNDVLQAPVLEAAVQALQSLMNNDEVLSLTVCRVTCALLAHKKWIRGEAWVWEFALAHILACIDIQRITDNISQAMAALFSHGNHAVQMVLAKPLVQGIRSNRISPTVIQSIAIEISHVLGSHNFLTEWCCALSGYFLLLPVVLSDCIFEDFQPIVTCIGMKGD